MSISCKLNRASKSGFTLIELIIVISIIGILATVVVPGMFSYLAGAKKNTTVANLKIIKSEIDNYKRNTGQYPHKLQDLVRKPTELTERQWSGPYLGSKDEPVDVPLDGWDNDFEYKYLEGGHPPYKLYSWGENGPGSPEDEWLYSSTKLNK